MNRNKYLQTLGLQPGVTKQEIKSAYRRLSKIYHPDVSKDADAKGKFILINEAYKFLMEVGAHPKEQTQSATAYDYDPLDEAYRVWRQKARAHARKKAAEAEWGRNLLIKKLLGYFNYAAVVIGIFNMLLAVDFLLPYQTRSDEIQVMERIYETFTADGAPDFRYLDVKLQSNQMRLDAGAARYLAESDQVFITSTSILNKPVALQMAGRNNSLTFGQAYGIYHGFGFFIPIVLISLIFYGFIVRNQENRFSLAVVLVVLFIIQIYVFIST